MAETNPTHVLYPLEEKAQPTLKIELITPRWSINQPGVRRSVVRAMDAAMKATA